MEADADTLPTSPSLQRTKSLKRKLANAPLPVNQKKFKQSQSDLPLPNRQLQLPSSTTISLPSDAPLNSSDVEEPSTSQFLDAYYATDTAPSDLLHAFGSGEPASPFFRKRASLYVAIPPVAFSKSSGTSSLVTLHLNPLLLTYYRPLSGVVLSFSDVTISEEPAPDVITTNALSACTEDKGASLVWLTATFLVLSPQRGDILDGVLAVNSGDFIGLILYNYFPVAIGGDRIPKSWKWHTPPNDNKANRERPGTGSMSPSSASPSAADADNDNGSENTSSTSSGAVTEPSSVETFRDTSTMRATPTPSSSSTSTSLSVSSFTSALRNAGHWSYPSPSGHIPISETLQFRVVDAIIAPGLNSGIFSLQIEGTLLSGEEEEAAVKEDRKRWDLREMMRNLRTQTQRGDEEATQWLRKGTLGGSERSNAHSRRRQLGTGSSNDEDVMD